MTDVPASPREGRGLGVIAVLSASAIWSFGGVLGKSTGAGGVVLSFWRLAMASLVVLAVAVWRGVRPTWVELRASAVAGLLFGLNLCAFFITLQYTTVSVALIIGALSPVVALPISGLFMGERVTAVKVGCALAAVAGVATAVLTAPDAADDTPTRAIGYVWAVVALFVWVLYLLQTKRVRATVGTVAYMTSVTWIAFATVAVLAAFMWRDLGEVHGAGWAWVLLLALGPGLAGHGLVAWAQPRVDASVTSVLIQLEPVGASLAAWVFLHERMSLAQSLAMVVVVAALSVLAWSETREGVVAFDEGLG